MRKKILIVEDDCDVIEALKLRLEASDYEVVSATNGARGLEVFDAERPDLILLDVAMSEMDGYTFVKTFKARRLGQDVPILVLTGKDGMQDMFELEGVKGYLTKPCNADELLRKIEELL